MKQLPFISGIASGNDRVGSRIQVGTIGTAHIGVGNIVSQSRGVRLTVLFVNFDRRGHCLLILSQSVILLGMFKSTFWLIAAMVVMGAVMWIASKPALLREQMLARAQASGLVSYFSVRGNSLAALARSGTTADMEIFMSQWAKRGITVGVILTDENGIVIFNVNVSGTSDTGMSVVDRDYFKWAKTSGKEGEFFVGKPVISRLGATKGKTIVPLASPVYRGGEFKGVAVAAIELAPLTERYLDMMKISGFTEVYLLDQDGNLLYAPGADLESKNVYEVLRARPFLGSEYIVRRLKEVLVSGEEGKLWLVYRSPRTGNLQLRSGAFTPAEVHDQRWLVVVTSPLDEAFGLRSVPGQDQKTLSK